MREKNVKHRLVKYAMIIACNTLLASAVQAQTLGANLAISGPGAGADGSGFSDTKLVRDGSVATYTQAGGTTNQRVSIKWSSAINFNTVVLREAGTQIGSWQLINNDNGAVLASGSGIGAARTVTLGNINSKKINLIVNGSSPLRMAEIEVYNATGTASSTASVSSSAAVSSSSVISSSSSAPASQTITYEAEAGTIYKGAIESNHSGFSGTGFVNYDNVSDSYAQWTVNQAVAGNATITFRFANGTTGNRPMAISVNGNVVNNNLAFNTTGAWNSWATQSITLNLNAGNNVIRAASATANGGPNMDRFTVTGGSVVGSSSSANSISSIVSSSSSVASVVSSSSSVTSSVASSTSSVASGNLSTDCINLTTNPNVNWRQTSLQSDQDIVKCLADSLGRPVGYGENARGGYNPSGNSKLTIITKAGSKTVEQQILDAITDDAHNWIVFDKFDFATEHEIGLYRAYCTNSTVLSLLDASQSECVNYQSWCSRKGFTGSTQCMNEFFNKAMNKSSIPIRIPVMGANKTIDGRLSKAFFRFSGLSIGSDSAGEPTKTSNNIILTHLDFRGAGHVEDHYVDPDMIRATGASRDIWIHKNVFDTTGDSAFDVKVGAYNLTMSFNKLVNVKRASLHGSSDSRTINAQITTTMHHNAFVTTDDSYTTLGNTMRRVPLLRRGTTHAFNNLFVNYRKELLSLRVGATALQEDNVFVVNSALQEKSSLEASLAEIQTNMFKDISGGNFRGDRNFLWFGTSACVLDNSTKTAFTAASGSVGNLLNAYTAASRATINNWRFAAGQDLVNYVSATAGKDGLVPFNSPLAADRYYAIGLQTSCQ